VIDEMTPVDRMRVAACVEACKGVPTEKLRPGLLAELLEKTA